MIAPVPKPRRSPAGQRNIYHLKITLAEVSPPIWRRLQVPGEATLGWLHAVIQIAMGWTNSHLHQFTVGEVIYSDPGFQLKEFEDDPEVLNESLTTLQQVASKPKCVLNYEYDFGDCWDHSIVVEKILTARPTVPPSAECLDGLRAGPPEDCSGAPGYMNLLNILRDPDHEEHESMTNWLGRPLDAEDFDRDKINKHLGMLRWPHTTQSQLRRILMCRDGHKA